MKIKDNTNIKYNIKKLYIYILLIPFLFPRGFMEYFRVYKFGVTAWLYAAVAAIIIVFLYMVINDYRKFKNSIFWMLGLYIYFIIDTLVLQRGINEGVQKLFVAPVLCLLCAIFLKKHQYDFIDAIANILIVDFLLNITIFSPLVAGKYFRIENNLLFIGHVQIASQLGILGIFVGYLIYRINQLKKQKALLLIALSILTMLFSKTSAAAIALLVIFACICWIYFVRYPYVFMWNSKVYVALWFVLNVLFLAYLRVRKWDFVIFGKQVTLNGRTTIWNKVFELMQSHELFGYGAYGTRIKVYWNVWYGNPEGMTYAHGQIQQLLLDGGLILLILFVLMLLSYVTSVKKVRDKKIRCMANICLLAFLLIMITESVTEYYYIFIFLSILGYLPEILSEMTNGKEGV